MAARGDGFCDSNGNPGLQCSLRAAIQEANTDTDEDFIHFGIPGGGVQRVQVSSPLPEITEQVDIDGYTQLGALPNTNPDFGEPLNTKIKIEVMGSGLSFSSGSTSSEVTGLAIGKVDTGPEIFAGINTALTVQGCFIGTDAKGKRDLGGLSSGAGMLAVDEGSLFGGTDPEDRNLVSGNNGTGIASNGSMVVIGNYVGTEADGRSPLPNKEGIFVNVGSLIQQNLIAFNKDDGIAMPNTGNSLFTRNLSFRNGEQAIDLESDGPTPNDPLDADTGANGLQNYPVIKSAKQGPGNTTIVKVKLNSTPMTTFDLEFFSGKRKKADAEAFIGETEQVLTDASGKASLKQTFFTSVKKGHRITATATDVEAGDFGATSELAKPVKVK